MPKYTYVCSQCGAVKQKTFSAPLRIYDIVCECGSNMTRQMPRVSKPTVKEVIDKRNNKPLLENQEQILKERKEHFFWSVEVPRMVASGVYTMETMVENGWVTITDDGKMVVNTKPVNKR